MMGTKLQFVKKERKTGSRQFEGKKDKKKEQERQKERRKKERKKAGTFLALL